MEDVESVEEELSIFIMFGQERDQGGEFSKMACLCAIGVMTWLIMIQISWGSGSLDSLKLWRWILER